MSVREEYEMICPDCGEDHSLDVYATCAVRLTSLGSDPSLAVDGTTEWDEGSSCQCANCGWSGIVGEAQRAARGEEPEHVEIKIHFSMEHREAQQSPVTEIARIMQSIQMNMMDGVLPEWSEIEDMRGDTIGEFTISVRQKDKAKPFVWSDALGER